MYIINSINISNSKLNIILNIPTLTHTPNLSDTIFVSIASYRDEECPKTLLNLYKNAKNPTKIFVGICQQNDTGDTDCLDEIIKNNSDVLPVNNIKIMRIPHYDAMGPTYARYMCSKLWNRETFYLQIDSHTQFVKGWDEICISSVKEAESIIPKEKNTNGKVALSYFPKANYNKTGEISNTINDSLPYTCNSSVDVNKIVRGGATEIRDFKDFPIVIPHIAAGMLFVRSNFLKTSSYDPWLTYVYEGEEVLLSARLWTSGYTLIAPKSNVCVHLYTDSTLEERGYTKRPLFWDDNTGEVVNKIKVGGNLRLRYLLGTIPLEEVPIEFRLNIDKYGMGKLRTLDEYYKFIGVDLKEKTGTNYCDSLYNLKTKKWVKFK
jgi:hypothetical protein